MPMLTDLDVALGRAGIEVWESPGWRDRGHGAMRGVRGILIHHTAGGGPNDWRVVQNGRPGLPGPLAQLTLERDGSVRLIAAGQCWHAGNGTHPAVGGAAGNGWLIAIEGVSRGVGGDWTPAQRREYPRVAAALCRHYRLSASAVIGHKEYATPRGRKIDPDDWDMHDFRTNVARNLQEDDMPSLNEIFNHPIPRAGEGQTGVTTLGATVAYLDSNLGTLRRRIDETANAILALEATQTGRDEALAAQLAEIKTLLPKDQTTS